VLDSQSVKAPMAARGGYDAAKKVLGRKRHIAVDTDGRLLMVNLIPTDIADSAGAQMILDAIRKRWPWLKHLFADGAYDRGTLMDKAAFRDFTLEIVRRLDAEPGFTVLPRSWLVERSFGWIPIPKQALSVTFRRLLRHVVEEVLVDPARRTSVPSSEIQGDDQLGCVSVSSSSARPSAGRYRPKFNSKSLGRP
jgi:hypothetical protein